MEHSSHGTQRLEPFLSSVANKVLAGYVTCLCEIYIDDVLLFGTTDNEYLSNTRKVLGRLREKKVTANPAKTKLDLKEVEYVGHLIKYRCLIYRREASSSP